MLPGKSPIMELGKNSLQDRQGRPVCTTQKLTKFPSLHITVHYCLQIFKDNFCFNSTGRGQASVRQAPQPWALGTPSQQGPRKRPPDKRVSVDPSLSTQDQLLQKADVIIPLI